MRIEDRDLLDFYQTLPCEICGKETGDVSGHHLKTKGSGGHDLPENLVALCFLHHEEIHKKGMVGFIKKYPFFRDILILRGWELNEQKNKWFLPHRIIKGITNRTRNTTRA